MYFYKSIILLFLCCFAWHLNGQDKPISVPGKPIIHYFPDSTQRKTSLSYFKNRQKEFVKNKSAILLQNQTTASYNPFVLRFATPPTANVLAVFNKATEIWSQFIVSGVPIVIDISWTDLGGNILGSAGPTTSYSSFDVSPNPTLFYPISLMEKLRGVDQNNGAADITAKFNSNFANWYIGIDGLPALNQIDLLSVVLHEFGHGLGFSGYLDANTSNQTAFITYPNIFDKYAQDSNAVSMINTITYPNNSNELFKLITGGNLFQSNSAILSENNNQLAKLYAPSTFSSGSSVYHVDQTKYPVGDPNALMTPSIAYGETTRDLGPIVKGLFKEIGWTKAGIYADLMKDVEPNLNGYLFQARACYSTYYGDAINNVKLFISEDNGKNYYSKPLNKSGDLYSYTLPYKAGVTSVRYLWQGTDSNNNPISYPAKANTYDSFAIQVDNITPTLSVIPNVPYVFAGQAQQKLPVVSATDNSGIQQVEAIYKINANGIPNTKIYSASNNTANAYLATLTLTGLIKGDTIFYKIKGTDKANTPNSAYYPASGWIAVPVLGPKTAVNAFGQSFENIVSTDFFMKGFSVQTPNGFSGKSVNSSHPYADGKEISYDGELGSDMYAYSELILLRPITIAAGEGQVSFDEIALVEPGASGTPFYSSGTAVNRNFFDYVIVQGSKDGGVTWVDLSAGWDANADSNWLSTWNSNTDIDGNSLASGTPGLLKSRMLSLTQNTGFVVGDQVMLRFRLMADYASYGWGWLIDNLKIQGSGQTISSLEQSNSLPIIGTNTIYISNSMSAGAVLSLTVTDADNDNLSYEMLSGGGLVGFGNRGQLTLLADPANLSDLSSIQVKVSDGSGFVTKTMPIVYCESSNNVNKNASNVTKNYSSNSTLISTQQITGTSKIVYSALQSITLQPGFLAEKGTVFRVQSGTGCR